jgi:hypothetical protein
MLVYSLSLCSLYKDVQSIELLHISLQTIYNNISALDVSLDPLVAAASGAAGSPAVEKGDWRGNNHSPKPYLHRIFYEF